MRSITESLKIFWRREILRDPLLIQLKRWIRDRGDSELRFTYPLNSESIVWDLGGYHGDFAAEIYARFKCTVFTFEPIFEFHEKCVQRFAGNPHLHCLNYGLSDADGWLAYSEQDDATSFVTGERSTKRAEVRSITNALIQLQTRRIDLIKINIEGGEFDVLPALIDSGSIEHVGFIQVQFHNFVSNASERRREIQAKLARTHVLMWEYPFIWESWAPKNSN